MRIQLYFFLLVGILFPTLSLAQLYQDYLGNGHLQGISVSSSGTGHEANGIRTLNGFPGDEQAVLADVSRFLAQASYGGSWDELERVAAIGIDAWLEEQLDMAPTLLTPSLEDVLYTERDLAEDEEEEEEDEFWASRDHFRSAWFHAAVYAPDQLRHRVALALSEIMVISDTPDELFDSGEGLSDYYDILLRHALGNYRDLLLAVSLHPTMGFYLSHYNNPKADPANNIHPDENYAREIMQLFSIGLYELRIDGSIVTNDQGFPVPTYTNADIKEFAKIFTGLGPGAFSEFEETDEPLAFGLWFEAAAHDEPMAMYEAWHEQGAKYLLRGQTIPAGQTGMQDIEAAIDNLFHHPNVGPFMARRLIQRLVTSNPTPGYIERVARTFNDNGQGVRGDLGATVKAILTDQEARSCDNRKANLNRAMLREPLIRYLHFCRALSLEPVEGLSILINPGWRFDQATGQMPLSANSVFNFFLPDYQPIGIISTLGLYGPEFEIHHASTAINYVNEVNHWTFGQSVSGWLEGPSLEEDGEGFSYPLAEVQLAHLRQLARSPSQLLDHLNVLLVHGQLSTDSYQVILTALEALHVPQERVDMALYLIMISPDYAILN